MAQNSESNRGLIIVVVVVLALAVFASNLQPASTGYATTSSVTKACRDAALAQFRAEVGPNVGTTNAQRLAKNYVNVGVAKQRAWDFQDNCISEATEGNYNAYRQRPREILVQNPSIGPRR